MFSIERYHDVSCGHRVVGHESKCAHLHGHNYRIHFTCEGHLDDIGRVIDFSVVKAKLCQWLEDKWDHKFLAWEGDHIMRGAATQSCTVQESMVWLSFNPTAENIAKHLVTVVGPSMLEGTGVRLVRCRVEETRKCSATYSIGE